MRLALLAACTLAALTACTPRPKRASGPTFAWDTANSVVRERAPVMPRVLGQWFGELPSADGAGRDFILYLNEDGSARMVTMFRKAGAERLIETGVWSERNDAVTVALDKAGRDAPEFLGYDLRNRELVPVAAWDSTLWGSQGPPVLRRR
ncbi:MAG TPA: copper resistance protein NlpE N-terminal domain-containing protein [Gemmatimonadales bacterium]|nr:copper resistance protein NlpE N-terminal domain-containing protein [Gemmatimonadales bacterium]